MTDNNYKEIIDKFFNDFDNSLAKLFNTRRILLIIMLASTATFFIGGLLSDATGASFLEVVAIIALLVLIVSAIIRRILKKSVKKRVKEQEDLFFDNVFMKIIAGELNADVKSKSYSNTEFKKDNANLGDVISSREIELAGFHNGCPYKITQDTQTVVDNLVYNKNSGYVVSYTPVTNDSVLMCNYRTKHAVDSSITITSPMARGTALGQILHSSKPVRMDNKNFLFEVSCDDAVAAYKFLTADVMESITNLNKIAKIDGILITADNMNILTSENLLDIHYKPSFSTKTSKNKERYNVENVKKATSESVEKIKRFLNASPAALVSLNR